MTKMPKFTRFRRTLPDEGRETYVLMRVEEIENKFYDSKKDKDHRKRQFEWEFACKRKPEIRVKVWSSTNLSIYKGERSKALLITETLLGKTLTDKEIDDLPGTDSLLAKECVLEIEHKTDTNGDVNAKVKNFQMV